MFVLFSIPTVTVADDELDFVPSGSQRGTTINAPAPQFAKNEIIIKFKTDAGAEWNRNRLSGVKEIFNRWGIQSRHGKPLYNNSRIFSASNLAQTLRPATDGKTSTKRLREAFPRRALRATPMGQDPDLDATFHIAVDRDIDMDRLLAELNAEPSVEFAQPNYRYRTSQSLPGIDKSFSVDKFGCILWGHVVTHAPESWNINQGVDPQGRPIVVAVIDTGVNTWHQDLSTNIETNDGEVAGNNNDDDGNGYVDDYYGYDFNVPGNTLGTCPPTELRNNVSDCNGHGTMVSGVIAALRNNGIAQNLADYCTGQPVTQALGVVGVAPQAHILPIKAFDANGSGFTSSIAQSIRYALLRGADVINCSLEMSGIGQDIAMQEAVAEATQAGVPVIFSTPDVGGEISYYTPLGLLQVLRVGTLAKNLQSDAATNGGVLLDLIAPGVEIASTFFNKALPNASRYAVVSGASIAAPYVSGAAALALAIYPDMTVNDIRAAIRETAVDVGEVGPDPRAGYGRIDIKNVVDFAGALKAANGAGTLPIIKITSPLPSSVLGATQSEVVLEGSIGGSSLTGYKVYVRTFDSATSPWRWISSSSAASVSGIITRIPNSAFGFGRNFIKVAASSSKTNLPVTELREVVKDYLAVKDVATIPQESNVAMGLSNFEVAWSQLRFLPQGGTERILVVQSMQKEVKREIALPANFIPSGIHLEASYVYYSGTTVDGSQGGIYRFDRQTGSTTQIFSCDAASAGRPACVKELTGFAQKLAWLNNDGEVFYLDATSAPRRILNKSDGSRYSSPRLSCDRLFAVRLNSAKEQVIRVDLNTSVLTPISGLERANPTTIFPLYYSLSRVTDNQVLISELLTTSTTRLRLLNIPLLTLSTVTDTSKTVMNQQTAKSVAIVKSLSTLSSSLEQMSLNGANLKNLTVSNKLKFALIGSPTMLAWRELSSNPTTQEVRVYTEPSPSPTSLPSPCNNAG